MNRLHGKVDTPKKESPVDGPSAPQTTRGQEFWRLFRQNNLAIAGLAIFVLFFALALVGLFCTSGKDPVLDPAMVRLQEKLRPPPVGTQSGVSSAGGDPGPGRLPVGNR